MPCTKDYGYICGQHDLKCAYVVLVGQYAVGISVCLAPKIVAVRRQHDLKCAYVLLEVLYVVGRYAMPLNSSSRNGSRFPVPVSLIPPPCLSHKYPPRPPSISVGGW